MGAKLHRLLETFTTTDWNRCHTFLAGQVSREHDIQRFYKALKEHKTELSAWEHALEKIRNGRFKHMGQKQFHNLQSQLIVWIEKYFVYEETIRQPSVFTSLLLNSYKRRGLFHDFELRLKRYERGRRASGRLSMWDDWYAFMIYQMRYFSDNPVKNKMAPEILHRCRTYLQSINQRFDQLLNICDVHLDSLGQASMKAQEVHSAYLSSQNLDQFLDLLTSMQTDFNNASFLQLDAFCREYVDELSEDLMSIAYDLMIHYCHGQFKQGEYQQAERLLDLYESGYERGFLLVNNQITDQRFLNVVNTACVCERFDRARQFIQNLARKLNPVTKKETVRIARAQMAFSKGDASACVSLLRDAVLTRFTHQLRRRWLLLCAYYSLYSTDDDFNNAQIKNFNAFIRYNKKHISPANYAGSLALSKIVQKRVSGASWQAIRVAMEKEEHVVFRSWLTTQIQKAPAG